MKKKRSSFFTFIFSLMPGAGHMFMGFMKMGVSLMSAFFAVIFLSSWLRIGPLLFILPVLWFYSFFDCINRRYSSDEEFAALEDGFLFSIDKLITSEKSIFQKQRLFAGVLFLLLGLYLIWNNFVGMLSDYLPGPIYSAIINITGIVPQMVLGAVIIIAGVKLVMGKKKEGDNNV